jgi:hypothetical protein
VRVGVDELPICRAGVVRHRAALHRPQAVIFMLSADRLELLLPIRSRFLARAGRHLWPLRSLCCFPSADGLDFWAKRQYLKGAEGKRALSAGRYRQSVKQKSRSDVMQRSQMRRIYTSSIFRMARRIIKLRHATSGGCMKRVARCLSS